MICILCAPFEQLSELHGNVFLETCEKCGTRYERSFYVMDDYASLYFEGELYVWSKVCGYYFYECLLSKFV